MLGSGRGLGKTGLLIGIGVIAALIGAPLVQRQEPMRVIVSPGSKVETGLSKAPEASRAVAARATTETQKPPVRASKMGKSSSAKVMPIGQISLNAGTVEDLEQLPGVGEKTAQTIIEYRNQFGPFQSVRDIMNVKGIGKKKFEKMEPYLSL